MHRVHFFPILVLDFACSIIVMAVANNNSQRLSVIDEQWGGGGDFILCSDSSELQIVEKFQRLRNENYPKEINFNAFNIQWTDRIASETIQTFQHYVDSSLRWNRGEFLDSDQSEPFFRVVEAAVKLKLFRRLTFLGDLPVQDLNPRLAAAIASVIREGRHLELVTMDNFRISGQAMAALATGLATAGQADGLRELRFEDSRFIGRVDSGWIMGAPEYLAAGLCSNTTLKKLSLDQICLDDASLAHIVRALSSHPALEALEIDNCKYGIRTMHFIHRWLRSDGCRLKKLQMNEDYSTHDQYESNWEVVYLFMQDLPHNTSLESLSFSKISKVDEDDINLLLGNLWKLPNLRSLDVRTNDIADFVSLAENLAGTMPAHRLRSLNLSNNSLIRGLYMPDDEDKIMQSILQLLEDVFPELGFLGVDFEQAILDGFIPSRVVLRLDRNRCFGPLQGGGATIPLSLWPLVMANANKNPCTFCVPIDPSRKATILFEMLQGPAFGGRGSL